MNKPTRTLLALVLAFGANAAALAGLHQAMTDGTQRAQLALEEPVRLVISAPKPAELAASHCPGDHRGTKAL